MSSKLEPVIWLRVLVTLAYMNWGTDVRTAVHDVMAIKPNFLTSMGYHIFLTMVLRARAPLAGAELRYNRELKHATFLSTRKATGSDFAKKLTSHVTDVKSQTSKLPIWRLW